MLTCFRSVSDHLLQANCAGVKYLYETLLFSGLLGNVTSGQPGTGSSDVALVQYNDVSTEAVPS